MLPTSEIILRLVIAAVLGSVVGLERERLEWAAGLRTHMLVCLGAALAMIVSSFGFHDILGTPNVTLDPSRVAAQVISGIGFIGAGTILFLRPPKVIRGLTTAAGLWTVAAIGLAVGGGLYIAAVTTTAITFIILAGIKPLERKFLNTKKSRGLHISLRHGSAALPTISTLLQEYNTQFDEFSLHPHGKEHHDELKIVFSRRADKNNIFKIMETLRKVEGVEEIQLINN